MKYARIQGGEIVEGPKELPASWRNISGLNMLSTQQLKDLGWLPVLDDPEPAYDPAIQRIVSNGYRIESDVICGQYAAIALSPEELQRRADLAQKQEDLQELLPSWEQTVTAINNISSLADAKPILLKMAKLLAWNNGVRPIS